MDKNQIREALIAGGVPPVQLDASGGEAPEPYSAILDPVTAEPLMIALAAALRPHRPTRIAVWEDIENSVVAYTVARHLGVTATRIVDASGILDYDGDLRESDRVAIVADAFRAERDLVVADRLVNKHGGQVVAVGALMITKFLTVLGDGVPTEVLWQPEGATHR